MTDNKPVSVERVRATFREVNGILFNPAPASGVGNDKDSMRTRDTVPWILIIPELGVVTTVLDDEGMPECGYVNPHYACTFASMLFNRLRGNPELLQSYQTQPETYTPEPGYMGKLCSKFEYTSMITNINVVKLNETLKRGQLSTRKRRMPKPRKRPKNGGVNYGRNSK
jgi:hypothetical protein